MTIQELLNHLDGLDAKATKGEWGTLTGDMGNIHIVDVDTMEGGYSLTRESRNASTLAYLDDEKNGYNDAQLIVALRNAYPSLRAEIKRLQEEVEKLKNPLPTQQEEREIYKKIYHNSCNTGCSIPCTNKV